MRLTKLHMNGILLSKVPAGTPNELYFLPEVQGLITQKSLSLILQCIYAQEQAITFVL